MAKAKNKKPKLVVLKDCSKCVSVLIKGNTCYCRLKMRSENTLTPLAIVTMQDCDWFKIPKKIETK